MVRWSARRFIRSVSVVFVCTGTARAHAGIGGQFTAPIPLSFLFVGAGATVALTAGWLAVSERSPTTGGQLRTVRLSPAVGRLVGTILRAGFSLVVLAAVVDGLVGRQAVMENLATVFTWPVWFRGVALVSILVGTLWPVLSPWSTVYRGLVWLEGRPISAFESVPGRLDSWVALFGFVVLLGVFDNLTVIPRNPLFTAVVIAVYALVMIVGGVCFGPRWLRCGDPLGVLYRLFARVAPIRIEMTGDETVVSLRSPWQGCLRPVANGPLVVFVVMIVYTVSFDGFTNTRRFQSVQFALRETLDTGPETSVLLYVAGGVLFIGTFVLCGWLVERVGTTPSSTQQTDWNETLRQFAPTVLPIAAAYEIAHNYTYVIQRTSRLIELLTSGAVGANPLEWLSLPVFWVTQVLLIVFGHVIAVIAAHYVASNRYETVHAARVAHLPLVVLMVAYTIVSLWIISQPVVT